VLSALPVAASVPGMRLLLPIGVGAAPLVAAAFERRALATGLRRPVLGLWLLAQLVLSGLALPATLAPSGMLTELLERMERSLPADEAVAGQTLVIVNAPVDVAASYVQVMREYRGAPRPRHLHWLATASSALEVARVDAHTLRLTLADGLLATRPERHYRGLQVPLVPGDPIVLETFTVTPGPLNAHGRPGGAQFRFASPLEAPGLRFVQYRDGRYEPFALPAVGQSVQLPAQTLVELLAARMAAR
jgi:hypothetical protein